MAKVFQVDTGNTLTTSLVSYWKLDEASGTRADFYGTNNLTDVNTVPSNTGKVGDAAEVLSTNSEYLTLTDNASISVGDIDFTFAGWLWLDSVITSNRDFIAQWRDDGANQASHLLQYAVAPTSAMRFLVSSDGSAATQVLGTTFGALSVDTWYFIVVYHSAATNEIGVSVNNGTFDTAAHAGGAFDSSFDFRLGAHNSTATGFTDGRFDEVGFWKKKLSAQEITDLYNGGNGQTMVDSTTFTPKVIFF